MKTARVLEMWDITLPEQEAPSKWFLDWMVREPRQVSKHLTAGWHAYQVLQKEYGAFAFPRAVEYFGGFGAQAMMIQEMFPGISKHVVQDNSRESVVHIRETPELSDVWCRMVDSYAETSVVDAELVGLDFGDFTVWRHRPGQPHRQLLDRVVELEPDAIVFTDIAGPYLHLHQERYETLLGPETCSSYEDYLYALVERLRSTHGYRLLAGFYHRWSAVAVLVPDRGQPTGTWSPTPSSPVGLEIIEEGSRE